MLNPERKTKKLFSMRTLSLSLLLLSLVKAKLMSIFTITKIQFGLSGDKDLKRAHRIFSKYTSLFTFGKRRRRILAKRGPRQFFFSWPTVVLMYLRSLRQFGTRESDQSYSTGRRIGKRVVRKLPRRGTAYRRQYNLKFAFLSLYETRKQFRNPYNSLLYDIWPQRSSVHCYICKSEIRCRNPFRFPDRERRRL